MTWYLSGPLSGDYKRNKAAMLSATTRLRAAGLTIVSPLEVSPDETLTWEEHMRLDIAALMRCDGIIMLSGWPQSRGAVIERELAEKLGIRVIVGVDLDELCRMLTGLQSNR